MFFECKENEFRRVLFRDRKKKLSLGRDQNRETMSMIFKFRMLSDETDRFVRDYEVPYDMNLADFHAYVRESVGYGDEGMASIYLSDAEWGKVREFTAVDMGFDPAKGDRDEGDMPVAMERVSLGQIIHERFGRLIYVFDLFTERRFFIELLEAKFAEEGVEYPRITASAGDPPAQYDAGRAVGATGGAADERSMFDEAMDEFGAFEGDDTYDDEY